MISKIITDTPVQKTVEQTGVKPITVVHNPAVLNAYSTAERSKKKGAIEIVGKQD